MLLAIRPYVLSIVQVKAAANKMHRTEQDLNLRGRGPVDFKSTSLTTRTSVHVDSVKRGLFAVHKASTSSRKAPADSVRHQHVHAKRRMDVRCLRQWLFATNRLSLIPLPLTHC